MRTILAADTAAGGVNHATTGATGGFHQITAPQNAGLPRVVFQELKSFPLYSFKVKVAGHEFYQIKVMAADTPTGTGTSIAGNLSERMQVLLKDNSLGIGLLYCRPESSIPPYAERDDVNHRDIYHKGFICELWLA